MDNILELSEEIPCLNYEAFKSHNEHILKNKITKCGKSSAAQAYRQWLMVSLKKYFA